MNGTITTAPAARPDGEISGTSTRLLWTLVGGLFVLDAFLVGQLIPDEGMVAKISALTGLLILLLPMLHILMDNLRSGEVRMNELVVLAVLAGASRGDFRTAGTVAFIMLLSLIIESRTAAGAKASLEALARLSPGKARRVLENGKEEEVNPESLNPNDLIRIRPGENVLADGTILHGKTSLQEASITGESLPADKGEEDTVFAGTVNLTGAIDVRVTRAGADTTLGKVRELILKAEKTKLPVTRIIDRYIHFYTPVILALALIVWLFTNDLARIVALFVAACPIALVLATPSAMVAALSAAARVGVLVKDVSNFEMMARINAFVFDKTGTLTTGTLSVARLAPTPGIESANLLRQAASAERQSNHPVAAAVKHLAEKVRVTLGDPKNLYEEPGRGIRANVDDSEVIVGNWAWMEENGAERKDMPGLDDEESKGMSLLYVMSDGTLLGWIGLTDEPRQEAPACVRALAERQIADLRLITGDRSDVARRVADALEITGWQAECVPADKVDEVEQMKKEGKLVAFVGDGVNDAPALAASHVGIALGAAGSDVAIESAAVALMSNDLGRLPYLLDISRGSRNIIVQNLALGAAIVAGGIGLSAAGMLQPVPAAVLQICGATAVALNSARLIRPSEEQPE